MARQKFANFDDARQLGTLNGRKTAKGALNSSDGLDFFQLNLSEHSSVSLQPQNVGTTIKVQLFDESKSLVGKTRFRQGKKDRNQVLERELEAGTFYLRVQGNVRQGNKKYKLRLQSDLRPATPQEPGSTAETAFNIGQLPSTASYAEFVGETDTIDFYRFELDTVSDITANITATSGALDTVLYKDFNNSGSVLWTEDIESIFNTQTPQFSKLLDPGVYYLKIERDSSTDSNTQYTLSFTRTSYSDYTSNPEPGNDSLSALSIGNLTSYTTKDYVGDDIDELDYYRFELDTVSGFTANISALSGALDTVLYKDFNNSGGVDWTEEIESIFNTKTPQFSKLLDPGVYYLKVERDSSNDVTTRYDLNFNRISYPDYTSNPEPGNSSLTALSIGNLTTYAVKDYVSDDIDEVDYYRFEINAVKNFTANITANSGALDTVLYRDFNNSGSVDWTEDIESVFNTQTPRFSMLLDPGIYYLKVERDSGTDAITRYDLSMTAS